MDGASSYAQLSNKEYGIPSGPAAEFEESSLIESIMIDSVMVISVRHHSSACYAIDYLRLLTSVCLAASIWPLGHPRSDRHVNNLLRPDCC